MSENDALSAVSAKDRLRDIQHEILEAIASGQELADVIDLLCQRIEGLAPGIICSVLSVDEHGRLHPIAAPSLPGEYSAALDTLPIGPSAGSCGTAAFRGSPVTVLDIATDPLWADFKSLALPIGLRACWSSPIKARDHRVVGTFVLLPLGQRPDRSREDGGGHLRSSLRDRDRARRGESQDPSVGVLRSRHRAAQPPALSATRNRDSRAAGAHRGIHRRPLPRPRQLQGGERHPWPPHRRRALEGRRPAPADLRRPAGPHRTDRRRRIRGAAAIGRLRGRCSPLGRLAAAAIDQPFDLQGHAVTVRTSIGFSIAAGARPICPP